MTENTTNTAVCRRSPIGPKQSVGDSPVRVPRRIFARNGSPRVAVWLLTLMLVALCGLAPATPAGADTSQGKPVSLNAAPSAALLDLGFDHGCAIRADGSAACWGLNTSNQASPPPGTFRQVSGGLLHSCGVRDNGQVVC